MKRFASFSKTRTHKFFPRGTQVYKCQTCGLTYFDIRRLKIHIEVKHPEEKKGRKTRYKNEEV